MRRLAGILLTVATIAAVLFTFTTEDAGASRAAARHAAGTTKADKHFCDSFDHLVRFLRHAPKPSALKSKEGKKVLAALDSGQPKKVAKELHTIVWTFSKMRDGGVNAITKKQDKAASAALFRVSVYAAPRCKQTAARAFAGAMIQQQIDKSDSGTSSTTQP